MKHEDACASPLLLIELGRRAFAALWCTMLFAHCVCVFYLCATGALYSMLTSIDMEYYAQLFSADSTSVYTGASIVYCVLGAAHGYRVVRMVGSSLSARHLVFSSTAVAIHELQDPVLEKPTMPPPTNWWQRVRTAIHHLWTLLFSRQGFFGIESGYFDVRFVFREAVEIVSQTWQVYTSSLLITKDWINAMYVAIIVINCWSTPLVQRLTRHSPPLERLACMLTDAFLDSGTSMLIPLIIFAPYWRDYDLTLGFDQQLEYDGVWFTNLVNEGRQIFASGWIDLVFKIIPHLSIFSCLTSVKTLVHVSPRQHSKVADLAASVATTPQPSTVAQHQLRGNGARIVHVLFFLWGMMVLILHGLAMHTASTLELKGCKQILRPWLQTDKLSCLVFDFNCYYQQTETLEPHDLDALVRDSLALLMLTHCPALTVPDELQNFSNLLGMEIYNCTISDWPSSAGLTETTHPRFLYITLVRTNMSTLPDGLLMDDLPTSLQDIEFAHVNVTEFPDELETKWANLWTLYIEHSNLQTIPDVLMRLVVPDFSLIGNNITIIPETWNATTDKSWYSFEIANNPIQKLPSEASAFYAVSYLSLENTMVDELPAWLDDVIASSATRIYASNTPFCSNQTDEAIATQNGDDAVLTCTYNDPDAGGVYPLAFMDTLHELKVEEVA